MFAVQTTRISIARAYRVARTLAQRPGSKQPTLGDGIKNVGDTSGLMPSRKKKSATTNTGMLMR
jgi:hypothetical protein